MRATVYVWILLRFWLHHHKNCAIAASWICYLICRAIAYYLYHINNAIFYQVIYWIYLKCWRHNSKLSCLARSDCVMTGKCAIKFIKIMVMSPNLENISPQYQLMIISVPLRQYMRKQLDKPSNCIVRSFSSWVIFSLKKIS